MNRKRLKILIISLQGIGDTMLALPAIKQYSENKYCDVTMVISDAGLHDILSRFEFIEDIYLWNENKPAFINTVNLFNKLKSHVFDEAFAVDPNGRRENLLLFLYRSRVKKSFYYRETYYRMLYFLNPKGTVRENGWHDSEANMKLFGLDSKLLKRVNLKDRLSDKERNSAKKLLKNHTSTFFITLHPGALSQRNSRTWFFENYIELCNRIISKFDCRFVLVGGEEEFNLRKKIAKEIKNNPIVLQNETLSQTIAIMSETDLFLGNDSGPMHLAASLNLPMLILWGSGDYKLTSPIADNCLLIRKNLSCSPCYNFTKPSSVKCDFGFQCIKGIKVGEVETILTEHIDFILDNKKSDTLEKIVTYPFVNSFSKLRNGPLLINLN